MNYKEFLEFREIKKDSFEDLMNMIESLIDDISNLKIENSELKEKIEEMEGK